MSSSELFAIDKAALEELITMSVDLTGYIEREKDPEKAHELREMFGFSGDILSAVENTPLLFAIPANGGAAMSVIPFDPTVYYFKNTTPHIDEDGHHYLLVILSDLVRLQDQQRGTQVANELRAVTRDLSNVIARYEPKGAA